MESYSYSYWIHCFHCKILARSRSGFILGKENSMACLWTFYFVAFNCLFLCGNHFCLYWTAIISLSLTLYSVWKAVLHCSFYHTGNCFHQSILFLLSALIQFKSFRLNLCWMRPLDINRIVLISLLFCLTKLFWKQKSVSLRFIWTAF